MKHFFYLLIVACCLASCSSNRQFTARKYTKGRYHSTVTVKHRVNKEVDKTEEETGVALAAKEQPQLSASAAERGTVQPADFADQAIFLKSESINQSMNELPLEPTGNSLLKSSNYTEKHRALQPDAETVPGRKSLLSIILSGAGIVFDIGALLLALVTLEYYFLVFTAIGLALGIAGLVFGIKGIKEYKTLKASGYKHTPSVVMGIVGTALGGVAILFAMYFSIIGAFIVGIGGV